MTSESKHDAQRERVLSNIERRRKDGIPIPGLVTPFARRAKMLVDSLAARAALIEERRKQRRAEHEADVDRRGVEAAIRLRRRRRKKEHAS